MASRRGDPQREARWWQALTNQAASGLSVREFCRRHKLTEASFYAWRRTIAERNGDAVRPETARRSRPVTALPPHASLPAFLPVRVADDRPNGDSIVLELAGGRVLRLPESMAIERLAALIQALEAPPVAAGTVTAGTVTGRAER